VKNPTKTITPGERVPRFTLRKGLLGIAICIGLGCLVVSWSAAAIQAGGGDEPIRAFPDPTSRLNDHHPAAAAVAGTATVSWSAPVGPVTVITDRFGPLPPETEALDTDPDVETANVTIYCVSARFVLKTRPSLASKRKIRLLYLYHKSLLC
jgi:hypothetical protein